jgi:hypothetical protein
LEHVIMTKIVYNACYGGFGLSHEAIMRYAEIKGITLYVSAEASGYSSYYLCPPEEWEQIRKEEGVAPVSPERFARSNALYFSAREIERNDPALAQVVEELGDKANGSYAELRIIELPAGTLYRIDEYDGIESVETKDTYDWQVA